LITQLGYVGFAVTDLERWELVATKVVGLAVSARGDDGTLYLRMDEYHHRILVHPGDSDDISYIGWQVKGPAELVAMTERLRAAGVEVTPGTTEQIEVRKVRDLVRFEDPAGYAMEIFYGPLDRVHEPFVPARPMVGFKASEQGLGHVVLRVPDRDACERFYIDVLGLKLSDYGSGKLAFFHCNPRHHSLAIAPADQIPGPRRIIHIMLEALSLDDLGTAMDLCEQHGVPMLETLGKHPNDLMVSFYLETPSKFGIEYGFGGRDIDDATWEVRRYDKRDLWGHRRIAQPATAPTGHG